MRLRYFFFLATLLCSQFASEALAKGPAQPKRVVALSPVLTEIIFSLGAGDLLVGTTTRSDHPPAAKGIPRVGDYSRPVLEKILRAKPDLILIQDEGVDTVSPQLRRLSVPLEILTLKKLSDFPPVVSKIASLLGRETEAQRLNSAWEASWAKISALQEGVRPFRFLIVLDRAPLIVAGGDTFVSQAFESCGGLNVAKEFSGYPTVQREWLAKVAPEVTIPLGPDVDGLSRLGPQLPKHVEDECLKIQGEVRKRHAKGGSS